MLFLNIFLPATITTVALPGVLDLHRWHREPFAVTVEGCLDFVSATMGELCRMALALRLWRLRGRKLGLGVQSFLNHADSLLLVTERCEATECQIICPVEPTVVSWVLHPFRPIVSALQVVRDLAAARIVLLLRQLLLHEGFVHKVQLCGVLLVLRPHLLDEVA